MLAGGLIALLAACGRPAGNCPSGDCGPRPSPDRTSSPAHRQPPIQRIFDHAVDRFLASPAGAPGVTNDAGQLAWGKGYVMLALIRVYQATGQTSYLDRFGRLADQVLGQTDQARGVSDYQGRSGPVWRTAGVYTAGQVVLTSSSADPVLQIRYAGQDSGAAAVTVAAGSLPGTFSLRLTHPSVPPVRLDDVSTQPGHDRSVAAAALDAYRSSAQWTVRVLGHGAPQPGTVRLTPAFYVFAVSTGMISYPLALYARTVLEDKALASGARRAQAERYLQAAGAAVAFHDRDWQESGHDAAGYRVARGAPVAHDGDYLPFNQSNALGQTLAELYRVTRHKPYGDKITKLAHSWRAALTMMPIGGVAWPYWPPFSKVFTGYGVDDHVSEYSPAMPPTQRGDDLSHAAITAEFATAAYGAGVGIMAADREKLITTYLDNLRTGSRTIRSRFDGPNADSATAIQAARWLGLDDERVARHAQAVVQANEPGWTDGSAVLAYGYLTWAAVRGLI